MKKRRANLSKNPLSKTRINPTTPKSNPKLNRTMGSGKRRGKIKSGGDLLGTHHSVFEKAQIKCLASFRDQLWVGGPSKIAIFNTRKISYLQDIPFKSHGSGEKISVMRFIQCDDSGSRAFLWCGFSTGRVIVFDAHKKRIYMEMTSAHKKKVTELCQVGSHVWSTSEDCTVRIWDSLTQKPLDELIDHKEPVRAISYVPPTGVVWTGGDEKLIKLRDCNTGKVKHTITGFVQGLCQLRYTSGQIWITGNRGSVFVFDAVKTMCLKEIRAYKCPTYGMECTNEEVWTLGEDKVMKVFSVKFQRTVKNIFGTNKTTWVTALMPVGEGQVWAHCSDGMIRVWSTLGKRMDAVIMKVPGGSGGSGGEKKKRRRRKKVAKAVVNTRRVEQPKTPAHSTAVKKVKKKKVSVPQSAPAQNRRKRKVVQAKVKTNRSAAKPGGGGMPAQHSREYQRELVTLRRQLEGATDRIGKYKERLHKRKNKLEETDDILSSLTSQFNDTQEKMYSLRESGLVNSREIDVLRDQVTVLEKDRDDFLNAMVGDLALPKKKNVSLMTVAKHVKKSLLKSETLRKELQYSKQDLLSHIQHLKQIHLNFVKMQRELGQKEKLISSLNRLIVETSNKDEEGKVGTFLKSLKEKTVEVERMKSDLAVLRAENQQMKSGLGVVLDHLRLVGNNFQIKEEEVIGGSSSPLERIKRLIQEIEKKTVDMQKVKDNAEVRSLLVELRDYIKK